MLKTAGIAVALAALTLSPPPPLSAQTGPVLTGTVVDSISGDPVSGAEVSLNDGRARVSTDSDGRFRITVLAAGTYTVHVVRLGYEDFSQQGVDVGQGGASLEITLAPAALPLSAITVSSGTFSFMGRAPSPRQTMSRSDIESVPQFAEDIFRAVNRLPGLSSGDYSAHFSVRGGRSDETLILLDGLEIYEPYHLKDFNDGAISVIDVEAIEGVELMTGGFPARYGNRSSGVFRITTRDPEEDRTKYSVGISLVNARAMGEGTFGEGKGSWFVSGRRGYLDLVLDLLGQTEVPSPSYYDVLGKLKYQISPSQSLALNVLQAGDTYTFDAGATTGFQDSISTRESANNRYGNSYVWLTHEALLGETGWVRTIASAGQITSDRDGTEFYTSDSTPIYALTGTRDFSVLSVKQEWRWDWTRNASLEFGLDARSLDATYEFVNVVNRDPDNPTPDTEGFYPAEERSTAAGNGTTLGAYLSNRLRVGGPLTLEVGGRYDRGSYTGDSHASPRINALVELPGHTNLRMGWGVYRQMQGIGDLQVLNGASQYFAAERSRQWTASVEHAFDGGGTLRVEAYRKNGDELRPVYRNWKGGLDVFPETNEDRILVHPLDVESRGVEIYGQRHINDRLSLRGSYALSLVDETVSAIDNINEPDVLQFGTTHPGPQDQRHALNVDATYRASASWSLNGSYSFHSGWPGTLQRLETIPVEGGTDYVVLAEPIYAHRLPAYHRLDARLTKRSNVRGGELRFFFEVSNLTNHTNVFGYDYYRAPTSNGGVVLERELETGFIILPSIGVSWTGWR